MNLRSRSATAVLLGGVLTAVLGTQAMAAPHPRAVRHPERRIAGPLIDYKAGIQNGRTTRVGPKENRTLLAAPLSTWQIVYKGNGWTAAAKAVMRNSVDYWAAQVQSDVPIKVSVTFKDLPGNTLGSAGPTSLVENWGDGDPAPIADTFYPIALANKLAGVDLNGSTPEIVAQFDSRMPWYMDTDNVVPANKISFRGTVLHELGHGLGFLGSGWAGAGGPAIGDTSNGHPWVFDLFTEKGDGTTLWNPISWTQRFPDAQTKVVLKGGDLWFEGPQTSPRAKLYAPKTWDPGSSYSHLDEREYPRGTLDSMMTPIGDFGEGNATAGPLTLRMFADMGWNTPVPTECSKPGDLDNDGFNDVIGIAGNGNLLLAPGTDTGKLLTRKVRGTGFGTYKHMVIQDWTGDGCADLLGYASDTRTLVLFPVTGDVESPFGVPLVDFDWPQGTFTVTGMAAVGDLDGDGLPDLLVRTNQQAPTTQNGQLWLILGDGLGGLQSNGFRFLGTGWKAYTEFFSAGDWNGDGRGDLFVRAKASNGTLRLFPGRANGTLGTYQAKGTGWNGYNQLFGSFDLTGDGLPEIVGRSASSGNLIIERATPTGGFKSGTPVISKGWGAFPIID